MATAAVDELLENCLTHYWPCIDEVVTPACQAPLRISPVVKSSTQPQDPGSQGSGSLLHLHLPGTEGSQQLKRTAQERSMTCTAGSREASLQTSVPRGQACRVPALRCPKLSPITLPACHPPTISCCCLWQLTWPKNGSLIRG